MKKKMQAGGVGAKAPNAPDKKGAFITVQKRNLPVAKKGCKKKKGK